MILHTILVRPYVFAFLIAFLVIGILNRGVRRTLFFLFSGYLIAWASEASSIRTGFPYGWYFYRYENLQGEWLNFGVPVWDSLSYTFLCFAGMSVAEFILGITSKPLPPKVERRVAEAGGPHRAHEGAWWGWPKTGPAIPIERVLKGVQLSSLSALFVTFLDIVIDPLAHRGSEWFLGDIYYYPNPGFYFGVPLSNFAGWFLVSFVIVMVNGWFASNNVGAGFKPAPTWKTWLARYGGLGLYFGIFFFNFTITLWIGAWKLAFCDLVWIAIPVGLLTFKKM